MFELKPDYEKAQARMNAFWDFAETDRPLVHIAFPKPNQEAFEKKSHQSSKELWLDIEYRVEMHINRMENTVFYGEAMPVFFPNLGPNILSAWAGCSNTYEDVTVWTAPCIFDWETDGPNAIIDQNHTLYKKMDAYTRLVLEKAKGRFIVGLTDLQPGGSHLAALRGPETLAMDLLENPEKVKAKIASSYLEYYPIFDYYRGLLKEANQPISTWLPLTSETSMYIPQNDFSCMISPAMFEEFFLEGIAQECRHYGQSIYHLDGPGALKHLDALLEIPELNAIQWVPGAGQEDVAPWIDVYKKIHAAGKSVFIYMYNPSDLKLLMENIPARGTGVEIVGVKNEEEAKDIMKIIETWHKK
ncbi:MAG: hypothetical protein FWC77_00810 [Defluviitaleaceae bacterium]|nr:hypothetical protein [Defluviitaleaceae bacterium]